MATHPLWEIQDRQDVDAIPEGLVYEPTGVAAEVLDMVDFTMDETTYQRGVNRWGHKLGRLLNRPEPIDRLTFLRLVRCYLCDDYLPWIIKHTGVEYDEEDFENELEDFPFLVGIWVGDYLINEFAAPLYQDDELMGIIDYLCLLAEEKCFDSEFLGRLLMVWFQSPHLSTTLKTYTVAKVQETCFAFMCVDAHRALQMVFGLLENDGTINVANYLEPYELSHVNHVSPTMYWVWKVGTIVNASIIHEAGGDLKKGVPSFFQPLLEARMAKKSVPYAEMEGEDSVLKDTTAYVVGLCKDGGRLKWDLFLAFFA